MTTNPPRSVMGRRGASRRSGDQIALETLRLQVETLKMQVETLKSLVKILRRDNTRLRHESAGKTAGRRRRPRH